MSRHRRIRFSLCHFFIVIAFVAYGTQLIIAEVRAQYALTFLQSNGFSIVGQANASLTFPVSWKRVSGVHQHSRSVASIDTCISNCRFFRSVGSISFNEPVFLSTCKQLGNIKGLQRLHVSCNEMPLMVADGLLRLRTLHRVEFYGVRFISAKDELGAGSGQPCVIVRELALTRCKSVGGILSLRSLRASLMAIDLSECECGASDLRHLADIRTLRSLNVLNTNIAIEDVCRSSLAPQIEVLCASARSGTVPFFASDRQLHEGTEITSSLLKMTSLHRILLDRFDLNANEIATFSELPYLEMVVFRGCRFEDNGLSQLSNCRRLTHLSFADAELVDKDLDSIVKLPRLTSLDVSGTRVGNEGLAKIVRCTKLRELIVTCSVVSGETVERQRLAKTTVKLVAAETDPLSIIGECKDALPHSPYKTSERVFATAE